MATLEKALEIARDREFRDRHPDADDDASSRSVEWVDAFLRLVEEGLDGLDRDLQRAGYRGERTKVVLHHEIQPGGTLGPGRLHLGPVLPDGIARFLRCDAEIQVVYHQDGRIVGVDPTQRYPNRATRRAIEDRDQGCAHPLCQRRVGLHVHHLHQWENDGPTVPANLLTLCRRHHRELHLGEYTIRGSPEDGTLRFFDSRGTPIEPPGFGSTGPPPPPPEPSPYTPPFGERLSTKWFGWN